MSAVEIAPGRYDSPVGIVLVRRGKNGMYACTFEGRRKWRYHGRKGSTPQWKFVPGLYGRLAAEPESLTWRGPEYGTNTSSPAYD